MPSVLLPHTHIYGPRSVVKDILAFGISLPCVLLGKLTYLQGFGVIGENPNR